MKRALLISSLLLFFCPALANAGVLKALVVEVNDGDTVTAVNVNRQLKVRLKAVDAPEPNQALGEAARQHLASLILKKEISIELTGLNNTNGRFIGKVYCNEIDIGLQMIRDGVAWYDRQYESDLSDLERRLYAESEQAARNERRGVWQDASAIAPWEFRKAEEAQKANAARPALQTPMQVASRPPATRALRSDNLRHTALASSSNRLLNSLPAADLIILMDLNRLTSVMTDLFGQSGTLANDLERMRAVTGIDLKSINQIAVAGRFSNSSLDPEKGDFLVLMDDSSQIEPVALVANLARRNTRREIKVGDRTLYAFKADPSVLGPRAAAAARRSPADVELGIARLASGALALGSLEFTKEALAGQSGASNGDLFEMFAHQPEALFAVAARIPAGSLEKLTAMGRSSDAESKELLTRLSQISIFYAGVRATAVGGLELSAIGRTPSAEGASRLAQMLSSYAQAFRMMAPTDKQFSDFLKSIEISSSGSDVSLSLAFTQAQIQSAISSAMSSASGALMQPGASNRSGRSSTRRQ